MFESVGRFTVTLKSQTPEIEKVRVGGGFDIRGESVILVSMDRAFVVGTTSLFSDSFKHFVTLRPSGSLAARY